jgi:2-polyprenyl-6-methoxyphenol hydroxylase-like FAD-dependent oxidoreductase
MGERTCDVVVVGARCAGSPLALLLARRGYDVVVVDKATFPSDTMSTHVVHPLGVAALDRWGLLERLVASGCPPIHTYAFDFGPLVLQGAPGTPASPVAYCPRRTVLDQILVDGAREAGAEVREGFTVTGLDTAGGAVVGLQGTEADGTATTVRARTVVGADGGHSFVARAVDATSYNERPKLLCGYYSYWSDLPMDGRFEVYARERRGFAAAPTNDDLTLVVGGWPFAEREANQGDIEGTWMRIFDQAPEFKERLQGAHRESPVVGTAVPNRFRVPYGPGWALVGDAGYERDFITAQGITDAFRDAELCATAIDEALSGQRPFDEAMAAYQATRDEQVLPIYELTQQIASLEPPPPELAQVLGAAQGNQEAMDGFAQVNAGTLSPVEFFSEENVGRIFAAAGPPG